jgi:hypothetical protein
VIEGESKRVTYEAEQPVEIAGGVMLTPGVYFGKLTKKWIGYEYLLELTADELKSLGAPAPKSVEQLEFDVSRLVRLEMLSVF